MRGKQGVENFRAIAKIRCLEQRYRSSKIDQSASRSQIEDAQGAGHGETLAARYRYGFAIIDQQQIGANRLRQRERRPLAPVQPGQDGIGVIRDRGRAYVEPMGGAVVQARTVSGASG